MQPWSGIILILRLSINRDQECGKAASSTLGRPFLAGGPIAFRWKAGNSRVQSGLDPAGTATADLRIWPEGMGSSDAVHAVIGTPHGSRRAASIAGSEIQRSERPRHRSPPRLGEPIGEGPPHAEDALSSPAIAFRTLGASSKVAPLGTGCEPAGEQAEPSRDLLRILPLSRSQRRTVRFAIFARPPGTDDRRLSGDRFLGLFDVPPTSNGGGARHRRLRLPRSLSCDDHP